MNAVLAEGVIVLLNRVGNAVQSLKKFHLAILWLATAAADRRKNESTSIG